MSAFRVMIRIIPLANEKPSFEPVAFSELTDGNSNNVSVLNISETNSGISYQVERLEDIQKVDPGETLESIDRTFTKKLKNMGFIQLKPDDVLPHSFDKSFKFSVPEVVSLKNNTPENSKINSLSISLVKDTHCKKTGAVKSKEKAGCNSLKYKLKSKTLQKLKKRHIKSSSFIHGYKKIETNPQQCGIKKNTALKCSPQMDVLPVSKQAEKEIRRQLISKNIENVYEVRNETISEAGNCNRQTAGRNHQKNNVKSKTLHKLKERHIKNSSLEHRSKKLEANNSQHCVTDSDLCYSPQTDILSASKQVENETGGQSTSKSIENELKNETNLEVDEINKAVDSLDSGETCKHEKCETQTILDSEPVENSSLVIVDESDSSNKTDTLQTVVGKVGKEVSTAYDISEDDPLYDLLEPFKNYFLDAECLICGFVAPEVNYNAATHMREHISENGPFSYYKCVCCIEKFCSPKNLYSHVLLQDKTFNYGCDICCLRFKRKYQFLRHNANVHQSTKE